MSDTITSPSFPKGIGPLRSEAEVRAGKLRYCEDCRFYGEPPLPGEFAKARCRRPRQIQTIELVSRAAKSPDAYCDLERGLGSACGPDGKLFERKTETADA